MGKEAQWWNPWPSRGQEYPAERYQPALNALRHVTLYVRGITGTLRDASRDDALTPPDHAFLAELAELLDLYAATVGAFAHQPVRSADGNHDTVHERVAQAERLHETLDHRLRASELPDRGGHPASGSLLLDTRRILWHCFPDGPP
ncbi:MAG: hypothetical protein ACRDTU_22330 [Micromonosporaceae bacterium]